MSKLEKLYNFRVITPSLTTSGQPTEEQVKDLAAEGIQVVINLALHDDPSYSLPDERGLVESLDLQYVHIPVIWGAPTEENLLTFFEALDAFQEYRVHVHCAANMRVTAFIGLYRLIRQGMSEGEAFAPMRTVWEPDDIWAPFMAKMIDKYTGKPLDSKI